MRISGVPAVARAAQTACCAHRRPALRVVEARPAAGQDRERLVEGEVLRDRGVRAEAGTRSAGRVLPGRLVREAAPEGRPRTWAGQAVGAYLSHTGDFIGYEAAGQRLDYYV